MSWILIHAWGCMGMHELDTNPCTGMHGDAWGCMGMHELDTNPHLSIEPEVECSMGKWGGIMALAWVSG